MPHAHPAALLPVIPAVLVAECACDGFTAVVAPAYPRDFLLLPQGLLNADVGQQLAEFAGMVCIICHIHSFKRKAALAGDQGGSGERRRRNQRLRLFSCHDDLRGGDNLGNPIDRTHVVAFVAVQVTLRGGHLAVTQQPGYFSL